MFSWLRILWQGVYNYRYGILTSALSLSEGEMKKRDVERRGKKKRIVPFFLVWLRTNGKIKKHETYIICSHEIKCDENGELVEITNSLIYPLIHYYIKKDIKVISIIEYTFYYFSNQTKGVRLSHFFHFYVKYKIIIFILFSTYFLSSCFFSASKQRVHASNVFHPKSNRFTLSLKIIPRFT